ncbi:MAG TPA: NUDIX domain-containing protein [Candidatus Tenderia sp.]|nr:NUDIX domain-containing protein [Candidatus Tenderia sp.]
MSSAVKQATLSMGAVVIRHNTVLLIKRKEAPKRGVWSIPVYPQQMGQTLQQTLEAEIARTTGMLVKGGRPLYSQELIEHDTEGQLSRHQITLFLAGHYLSGNPVAGGEAEDVAWVSVEAMEFMEIDEEALLLLEALAFLELEDE